MQQPRDRMAREQTRTEKPGPVPVVMVPPTDTPAVVRCPHCGAARMHQWDKYSGGVDGSEPYKQCRSCGAKYVFLKDGHMRLVG